MGTEALNLIPQFLQLAFYCIFDLQFSKAVGAIAPIAPTVKKPLILRFFNISLKDGEIGKRGAIGLCQRNVVRISYFLLCRWSSIMILLIKSSHTI